MAGMAPPEPVVKVEEQSWLTATRTFTRACFMGFA